MYFLVGSFFFKETVENFRNIWKKRKFPREKLNLFNCNDAYINITMLLRRSDYNKQRYLSKKTDIFIK